MEGAHSDSSNCVINFFDTSGSCTPRLFWSMGCKMGFALLLCPTPNRRGIKRWCCLTSVAYIGPKSRTERPRKTKIGTEVYSPHHSWLRHHFLGQKYQRPMSPGGFIHRRVNVSGSCSGERGNVLAGGNYCYVVVCSVARGASAPTEGWEGRGYIVAAARLQLVTMCYDQKYIDVFMDHTRVNVVGGYGDSSSSGRYGGSSGSGQGMVQFWHQHIW